VIGLLVHELAAFFTALGPMLLAMDFGLDLGALFDGSNVVSARFVAGHDLTSDARVVGASKFPTGGTLVPLGGSCGHRIGGPDEFRPTCQRFHRSTGIAPPLVFGLRAE
jgi:hypothetical protein